MMIERLQLDAMIQINDLLAKIRPHQDQIALCARRVVSSGYFILGPEVENFEQKFAEYIGSRHCVSVANGTDAIELGLRSLGIKRGDCVATVANAGMYTTTAILAIGAIPYFMDVDLGSMVVSLDEVNKALTHGVNAIVVTHLYGLATSDIESIAAIAKRNGVPLLEDCAQAHGAMLNGKKVGTFGDISSFSFYPTKNLGALGDGGAICTNDQSIAENVKRLRQYGWKAKYDVELLGARNSRLDEMQAAILSYFLPMLDSANSRRQEIAKSYCSSITNSAVQVSPHHGENHIAHLFVIRSRSRESLKSHLKQMGVNSDVHYPIPDHKQTAIAEQYKHLVLENTEILAREVLTLPCYPELDQESIQIVVNAVNSWAP
jgi:dTDP-4-amino-4,6-dideoxygalactose transaminase